MQWAIIENGLVTNIVIWDGKTEWESELVRLVNIDDIVPEPGIGWYYNGSIFTPPPVPEKTKEELIIEAEAKKAMLIEQANDHINAQQWPSKLSLGRISDNDKAEFNLWLDYLDALNAVDTSGAPDITWPEAQNGF